MNTDTTTTTPYTILTERPKALLVQSGDGFSFWIQRRWWGRGKLSPAGRKAEMKARVEARVKKERDDIIHSLKWSWESVKCVAIDMCAEFVADATIARNGGARDRRVRVFIPRACLEGCGGVRGSTLRRFERQAMQKADLHPGYAITRMWV